MIKRLLLVVAAAVLMTAPAIAQQNPLVTTGGQPPELLMGDAQVRGSSVSSPNLGGPSTKYPTTSNILTNVVGAKSGYFGAAAKDGLTWAETYLPGTDTQTPHAVQLYSLSTSGNYGGYFGSRSSDNGLSPQQNIIGMIGLGVADHMTNAHRVWGGYSVAYQAARGKQTILFGHEITTDNRAADAPRVTPADPNPAGVVSTLRITCGDGEAARHHLCSSAISTVHNGAAYRTGLLFADGSINKVSGYADAIAMPNDYGMSWNASGSVPEWRIFSNAGPLAYTNSIILGVNTVDFFLSGGGARPLHLTSEGTVTSGTHQLVPTKFARLPNCDTEHAGSIAFVDDAQAAIKSWNQPVSAGGGSNKAFVKCNGTGWNAF